MLITGVFKHGYEVGFQLIKGKNGLSLALFNFGVNSSNKDWVMNNIQNRVTKQLERSIITHALLKVNYDIRAFYGNKEVTEEFIQQFLKFVDINAIWYDTEYRQGSKGDNTTFIEFDVFNSVYASVNKWKFLSGYTSVDSRSKLAYLARLQGVRSLEQLKMIYDLSWILNEDDSFKRDYRCITTEDELNWVIDNLMNEKHKLIGFDTETTGVNIFYFGGKKTLRDEILGFSLSWSANQAVYIPLESNKFKCLDKEAVIQKVFPILEKKNLIMANGAFDVRVAYDLGYHLNVYFDTMIAQYDLDPKFSMGRKSLKFMSRQYLGEQTLELDEVLGGSVDGRLIRDLDKNVITIYGCADAEQLLRLYPILRKELISAGLVPCFTNDMKLIPITAIAEYYSVKLDLTLLEKLTEINQKDLSVLTNFMNEYLLQQTRVKVIRELFFNTPEIKEQIEALRDQDCPESEIIKKLMEVPLNAALFNQIKEDPEVNRYVRSLAVKHNKAGAEVEWNYGSPRDIAYILYELLNYPVTKYNKKKKVSNDNEALESLLRQKLSKPTKALREDLTSCVEEYNLGFYQDPVLLNAEKFNSCKYPFAYVLQVWRELDKLKTGFYESLNKNRIEEYRCTTNNMTAADTGRIINPIQTLKKDLKRLVISPSKDFYMIDFDAAQIEFRVMIGLASASWNRLCKALGEDCPQEFKEHDISYLVDRLNIPWTDYHREGGAPLVGTTPAKMTKKERSRVKGPHFAIPYGGEAPTIAKEKLLGVTDPAERQRIISETEEILSAWKNKMFPLYWFLESIRDQAITPLDDETKLSPILRDKVAEGKAMGIKRQYGCITNSFGRRIFYNLSYEETAEKWWVTDQELLEESERRSVEEMKEAYTSQWEAFVKKTKVGMEQIIRRAAGNYPIQSFAREIFVKMMLNLRRNLKSKGLSGLGPGNEKVIQNVFIHDENLLLVHKSVHPFEMYKIIYDSCMITLPNHPRYYCGISVVGTWYDAKDDSLEAPIEFVQDMIKSFEDHKEEYLREDWQTDTVAYTKRYIDRWVREYCDKELQKWIKDGVLDLNYFREHNENYFLLIRPVLHTDKFQFSKDLGISYEECCCIQHIKDKDTVIKWDSQSKTLRELGFDVDTLAPYDDLITSEKHKTLGDSSGVLDLDVDTLDSDDDTIETNEFLNEFFSESGPNDTDYSNSNDTNDLTLEDSVDLNDLDFFDYDDDVEALRDNQNEVEVSNTVLNEDIVFEDLALSEDNLAQAHEIFEEDKEYATNLGKPKFCMFIQGNLHIDFSRCKDSMKTYETVDGLLKTFSTNKMPSIGVFYHVNTMITPCKYRVKPSVNVTLLEQILQEDYDSSKRIRNRLEC